MKRICTAILAVAVILLTPGVSRARESVLGIGDAAPALKVKKFVKGDPVTGFEQGKLYVVEFWATWCGPCKVSIPHLTELQKKYKDVTFVGVSVFEQSQDGVAPFVTSMGDKMAYRVALDEIPEGKDGQGGVMATTWMQAAHQDGIPTAFIINKESKLAWIGHPMEMEGPLSKVVAGTWDLKTAAAEATKKQQQQAILQELNNKIGPLMQKKDYAGALDAVNKAAAQHPEIEEVVSSFKMSMYAQLGKDADAAAYGTKLVAGPLKDNVQGLNSLAWGIVNPDNPKKPSVALAQLAVKAAKRADELSNGKDPSITDTLAAAYFAAGNKTLAISTEERAIKNCTDAQLGADLKKSLERFKK